MAGKHLFIFLTIHNHETVNPFVFVVSQHLQFEMFFPSVEKQIEIKQYILQNKKEKLQKLFKFNGFCCTCVKEQLCTLCCHQRTHKRACLKFVGTRENW